MVAKKRYKNGERDLKLAEMAEDQDTTDMELDQRCLKFRRLRKRLEKQTADRKSNTQNAASG